MIGLMDGIKVLQGLLIRHRAPAQRVTTNKQRWRATFRALIGHRLPAQRVTTNHQRRRATLRGAASINPVDVLVLEGAA